MQTGECCRIASAHSASRWARRPSATAAILPWRPRGAPMNSQPLFARVKKDIVDPPGSDVVWRRSHICCLIIEYQVGLLLVYIHGRIVIL